MSHLQGGSFLLCQKRVNLSSGITEDKMNAPTITIFVRHSKDCKNAGDEFAKRCNCVKWLRWTPKGGKRQRISTETRSWAGAEQRKREIEDQLSGRSVTQIDSGGKNIRTAIDVFLADKRVQGITADPLAKYTRELGRLATYCEAQGVYTVQGIDRELLTGYCSTWESRYPSSQTRSIVRARLRSFLRYSYEAKWLERIPATPKVKVDEVPTMPLAEGDFSKILAAVDTLIIDPERRLRARGLLLLMRWSGLALGDACKLRRAAIQHDKRTGVYRVVTHRQKTGTDVSVPIPPAVAEELLRVPNDSWTASKNGAKLKGHPDYVFWDAKADIVQAMTKTVIGPTFKAACVERVGNMTSHLIRDTFAVDLLERGVPMEELSRLLGHTSIRTTEKSYAKWSPGRQDRTDALVMSTWVTPSTSADAPSPGARR